MTLKKLIKIIQTQPEILIFDDVINTINNEYSYVPSRFTNGRSANTIINEASTNEGSCKIFAFAKLKNLSKEQTLACFGKYYHQDVLQHPSGTDHANIRALIKYSLDDILFDNTVLSKK